MEWKRWTYEKGILLIFLDFENISLESLPSAHFCIEMQTLFLLRFCCKFQDWNVWGMENKEISTFFLKFFLKKKISKTALPQLYVMLLSLNLWFSPMCFLSLFKGMYYQSSCSTCTKKKYLLGICWWLMSGQYDVDRWIGDYKVDPCHEKGWCV
jgi:hypothetical protein